MPVIKFFVSACGQSPQATTPRTRPAAAVASRPSAVEPPVYRATSVSTVSAQPTTFRFTEQSRGIPTHTLVASYLALAWCSHLALFQVPLPASSRAATDVRKVAMASLVWSAPMAVVWFIVSACSRSTALSSRTRSATAALPTTFATGPTWHRVPLASSSSAQQTVPQFTESSGALIRIDADLVCDCNLVVKK